jgi:hypothetical protein
MFAPAHPLDIRFKQACVLLATTALLSAQLWTPAIAAPGDGPLEAIPIDIDGRFSGSVEPQSARWYRFSYRGGTPVTITVAYEPAIAGKVDLAVYTGDPANPRAENLPVARRDNTLSAVWSDPSGRDVFLQVIDTGPVVGIGFVGSVQPTGALNSPGGNVTPTPAPASGTSAADAATVGGDGRFAGMLAPRQAAWYRFWYANPGANATLSVGFTPAGTSSDLNIYTGTDINSLSQQGGAPSRTTPTPTATPTNTPTATPTVPTASATSTATPTPSPTPANLGTETLSRTVNLATSQWVYFTVANNNDGTALAYGGTVSPAGVPPTASPTPTPTATPTATPTPTPTPVAQAVPPVSHDGRYFVETRFRIDNDAIWGYFQARGGVDVFGFPVSRTFSFLGCTTQILQRQVAQVCIDGQPRLVNLLDPEIFPYTQVNGSTFPAPDPSLKALTPQVGDPSYATTILEFVRLNAPDTFNDRPVGFARTFFGSVQPGREGTSDPGILGLLDLEVWGVPISRPQPEPSNQNFIYQRFQRGIMHYDATTGVTRGILLADYLKSILTGQNVPADLRQQAQGSRLYAQYSPGAQMWLARPWDLPGTDLTFAFEQG